MIALEINKKDIIRLLETIALYLELKGENPFKIQAFRRAAASLERDERSLKEISDFTSIPNIGKGTAAVIEEYIETGSSNTLKQLQKEIPVGLIPLLQIPGLGGKTVSRLYHELSVENVHDLKRVCEEKKVRQLKGFGPKKEKNILKSLEEMRFTQQRFAIGDVLPVVKWIEEQLLEIGPIHQFSRAGSVRRMEETVKDLDFVVSTRDPQLVKKEILNLPDIKDVINEGDTKITCVFSIDPAFEISVDFRIVKPEEFATALHHFTGSKEHNIRMRQIAKERNEKLSEYGVECAKTGRVTTFSSEKDFFNYFNLPWISPELRKDGSEIDKTGWLNELITLEDIRGDLHIHTTWSDGACSIEEMIEACRERGYEYMAITDHSQYLKVANGLTPDRLKRQVERVRELNEKYDDITVLTGSEVDILPDGSIDFDHELLSQLDFVIASIHSAFGQSEEMIMKRLEAACKNPYVDMIAHPTGRIIGKRDGYAVDIGRLIEMAGETNTILELNASPERLDLKREHLKMAQEVGVKIMINTDSHQIATLQNMEIGVQYARSAWIKKDTVINTKSVDELIAFLHTRKNGK